MEKAPEEIEKISEDIAVVIAQDCEEYLKTIEIYPPEYPPSFSQENEVFKGLKKGLEEVLSYTEGKINLKSEIIDIPEPPYEYRDDKDTKK